MSILPFDVFTQVFPIDVFDEIASFLNIDDLVILSRVSRHLIPIAKKWLKKHGIRAEHTEIDSMWIAHYVNIGTISITKLIFDSAFKDVDIRDKTYLTHDTARKVEFIIKILLQKLKYFANKKILFCIVKLYFLTNKSSNFGIASAKGYIEKRVRVALSV